MAAQAPQVQAQSADATSLNNKVMAGYQGWFRAPNDRPASITWAHWFNSQTPDMRNMAFDTWPDMSEYSAEEKHAVPGFSYADGSQAYLYSAQNYHSVLRHFEWMRTAGIDGVWLSQFCIHMPGGPSQSDYPNVETTMNNVRQAATATGRTWAYMWDTTGVPPDNVASIITNQWKKMVDSGITADPRYLHHEGKPVLLIWGFFPDREESNPEYFNPIIDFLQTSGKYQAAVVGGGEPFFRTTGNDAFKAMLMRMTAWMPWQVGRAVVDFKTGFTSANTKHWQEDVAMCASNHVIYIPVLYAGTHIAGGPPVPPQLPVVPRRNGNMLWEQFVAASKIPSVNSVFIAMFDEVNEGTQIMKVSNTVPTNAAFITYEGATSDWYMRLVNLGEKMLRSRTPITMPVPISPFDTNLWYRVVNKSSGLALDHTAGVVSINQSSNPAANVSSQWRLCYDGTGYFSMQNRIDEKWLSSANPTESNLLTMQNHAVTSDDIKWEFIWDGTGGCKIRNKANGKMLHGAAMNGVLALQAEDVDSDSLRWLIKD